MYRGSFGGGQTAANRPHPLRRYMFALFNIICFYLSVFVLKNGIGRYESVSDGSKMSTTMSSVGNRIGRFEKGECVKKRVCIKNAGKDSVSESFKRAAEFKRVRFDDLGGFENQIFGGIGTVGLHRENKDGRIV